MWLPPFLTRRWLRCWVLAVTFFVCVREGGRRLRVWEGVEEEQRNGLREETGEDFLIFFVPFSGSIQVDWWCFWRGDVKEGWRGEQLRVSSSTTSKRLRSVRLFVASTASLWLGRLFQWGCELAPGLEERQEAGACGNWWSGSRGSYASEKKIEQGTERVLIYQG